MATHTYQPLESAKHIRLLKLLPDEAHEPICTELVHTSLDDAADVYEAASYTWGVDEPSNMIRCNGHPFGLRRNAYDLMQRLRRLNEPCTIWMDCICINQEDTKEREAQVKIMHLIYRQAKSVCIWLGLEADESSAAMQYAAKLDPRPHIDIALKHARSYDNYWYRQKAFLFDDFPETRANEHLLNALTALMQRPWLRRVWVQQEAVFCLATRVLCGDDEVGWDHFFSLAWIMTKRTSAEFPDWVDKDLRRIEDALRAVVNIQSNRATHLWMENPWEQDINPNGYVPNGFTFTTEDEQLVLDSNIPHQSTTRMARSLIELASNCAGCQATDPRDKVYALLNLTTSVGRTTNQIDVDYTAPWPTVYTRAAEKMYGSIFPGDHRMMIISAGRCNHPGADLPSWVPDWRQNIDSAFLHHNVWFAGGAGYTADIKFLTVPKSALGLDFKPPYAFASKKGQLKRLAIAGMEIAAILVDKVIYISPQIPNLAEYLRDDAPQVQAKVNSDLTFIQQQVPRYFTGESGADAYAGTIIAGTRHSDEIADAAYERAGFEEFKAWLFAGCPEGAPGLDYYEAVRNAEFLERNCFCVTAHGLMCLAPRMIEIGDHISILQGIKSPVTLRKAGPVEGQYYELLGQAYVHRMMRGRAWNLIHAFRAKYVPGSEDEIRDDVEEDDTPLEDFPCNAKSDYTKIRRVLGKRKITLV